MSLDELSCAQATHTPADLRTLMLQRPFPTLVRLSQRPSLMGVPPHWPEDLGRLQPWEGMQSTHIWFQLPQAGCDLQTSSSMVSGRLGSGTLNPLNPRRGDGVGSTGRCHWPIPG